MKNETKKIIAIVGPTASGKTSLSVELAKVLKTEIISADSRQIFREFDIATAKPTAEEKQGIKHHLMDFVEPTEEFTVADFKDKSEVVISDLFKQGKTPIVVGGTGLYFRVLLENYNLPKVEPNYQLREELKRFEFTDLYNRLAKIDKLCADSIAQNDKKKIIRAIEIVETLGVPMNEARGINEETSFDVEWIGRNFERKELYERINKRVDLMIDMGLVEETQNLLKKHGRIPNLIDTIGYKEMVMYLDGKLTLAEACDLLRQNTRNYAKRQLTWFRKNQLINWNVYPELLKK